MPNKKNNITDIRAGVAVLGATGSVGRNALAVLASLPTEFRIEVLSCHQELDVLRALAASLRCDKYFCATRPGGSTLPSSEALMALLQGDSVDIVVCAIQGVAALPYVLAALKAGKRVCLATKELLVATGEWLMRTARECQGEILPVDSEHCAIFQCLKAENRQEVRRLWLTCSGGPFHAHPEIDLHSVTPRQALCHPTWDMGDKITLDCATLMNKAFELIEASWLFGMPEEKLGVVIHPQSLVHSMVEYSDGMILAQLASTDMRLPIQYCLTYPCRMPCIAPALDFAQHLEMQFLPPDTRRFPALELGRRALRQGGNAGALMIAADEAALQRFRQGSLPFDEITHAIAAAMEQATAAPPSSLEELTEIEITANEIVRNY